MKQLKILMLIPLLAAMFFSCKTKKECPTYEEPSSKKEQKEGTQYKLILLKDGKKVGTSVKKRNKKAKQKLFKKKVLQ
tara:strand:- start:7589 stop:7822 length:234 start_codon:yes stop_codon:yes gene_type:complete